jgi:nitrate/TMAO reductase-like tetraheme cytochrome c subunit
MFSQKCVSCHNVNEKSFQTSTHSTISAIQKNCIDCHMPAQPSKSIAVKLENDDVLRASLIRTHLIGIYKQTKK